MPASLEGVDRMAASGRELQRTAKPGGRLDHWAKETGKEAVRAAERAAGGELARLRAELLAAARSLSEASGEARRAAWMYFGGFWVWLIAMLATGAFLGLLAAYITETAQVPVQGRRHGPLRMRMEHRRRAAGRAAGRIELLYVLGRQAGMTRTGG